MGTLETRMARSEAQVCAEQRLWCWGNIDIRKPEDQHMQDLRQVRHEREYDPRLALKAADYAT